MSGEYVYGTYEDIYVEIPEYDKDDDDAKTRCMWCRKGLNKDNDEVICAMYVTKDESLDWTGEYIHRMCDYDRSDATALEKDKE